MSRKTKNKGGDLKQDLESQEGKSKNKKVFKTKKEDSSKAKGAGHRTDKFEFFYSKFSPFSQHYACKFEIEGVEFNCAEQYMMYQKAIVFGDKYYADLIRKTDKPAEQKKYGRKVRNFDPAVWRTKSLRVVEAANLAKFSQNSGIKATLLNTYPRELVEASPRDRLWGIGLGMHNPKARDRTTWRGKNQLGNILTKVRDKLKEGATTTSEDFSKSSDDIGKASKDEGVKKIKFEKFRDEIRSTREGSSSSTRVIGRAPNDQKTVLAKDLTNKGVSGKKRKLENDKDFNRSKKYKMSDDRKRTKEEINKYEWVEKTKAKSDEVTDKGQVLHIEGNYRNTSRGADEDELSEEKKERRREKRRRRKEKKREEKRVKKEKGKEVDREIKEQKKEKLNEEKRKEAKRPKEIEEEKRAEKRKKEIRLETKMEVHKNQGDKIEGKEKERKTREDKGNEDRGDKEIMEERNEEKLNIINRIGEEGYDTKQMNEVCLEERM